MEWAVRGSVTRGQANRLARAPPPASSVPEVPMVLSLLNSLLFAVLPAQVEPDPSASIRGALVVAEEGLAPEEILAQRPYVTPAFQMRQRTVRVEPRVLHRLGAGAEARGERFDLELFPGLTVALEPEGSRVTLPGSFVVWGTLAGDPNGRFTLASVRGRVAANVRTGDGGLFALRHLAPGLHWIAELDESAMPACAGSPKLPSQAPSSPQVPPLQPPPSDPRTAPPGSLEPVLGSVPMIDVLILYTPYAKSLAGGPLALRAEVEVAIQEANLALELSEVDLGFELVGYLDVDYDGDDPENMNAVDIDAHLVRMTDPDDGWMDIVPSWSGACGADMTAMITGPGSLGCGVAWLKPGITPFPSDIGPLSVTTYYCLPNLTLAHEFGHSMGCAHDKDNTTPGVNTLTDARGYRFDGNSGTEWRTIMAYAPGDRIYRFSNPNVNFDGQPTGVAGGIFVSDPANNVNVINLNSLQATQFALHVFKPSTVYVDLDNPSSIQTGDSFFPYDDVGEGLLRLASGGTLVLRGSGPTSTPSFLFDATVIVDGGTVSVGGN